MVHADFDDPTSAELRARSGEKWSSVGIGILPAHVAETDFRLPACVRLALEEAVVAGRTGYPDARQPALFAAWADYAAAYYGLSVDATHVRLMPDVMKGVAAALAAFTPAGSTVVVPTPSFPPTFLVPARLGYRVEKLPLLLDAGRSILDLTGLRRAFAEGAHTLCLIQPHNPTGTSLTAAELAAVAEIVAEYDGRVISDEIFAPASWHPHVPYAAASPTAASHCVTVGGPAKAWGFPGLRCALLTLHSDRDAMRYDDAINPWDYTGASSLGVAASTAAYQHGESWRAAMADYVRGNAQFLQERLSHRLPLLRWQVPDATYLAWIDLRPYGFGADAAARLRAAGLVVVAGTRHGAGNEGWVRLNIGTTRTLLDEAIRRLCVAAGSVSAAHDVSPAAPPRGAAQPSPPQPRVKP